MKIVEKIDNVVARGRLQMDNLLQSSPDLADKVTKFKNLVIEREGPSMGANWTLWSGAKVFLKMVGILVLLSVGGPVLVSLMSGVPVGFM